MHMYKMLKYCTKVWTTDHGPSTNNQPNAVTKVNMGVGGIVSHHWTWVWTGSV